MQGKMSKKEARSSHLVRIVAHYPARTQKDSRTAMTANPQDIAQSFDSWARRNLVCGVDAMLSVDGPTHGTVFRSVNGPKNIAQRFALWLWDQFEPDSEAE